MTSKIFKIGTVLLVCMCLFSFSFIPASAVIYTEDIDGSTDVSNFEIKSIDFIVNRGGHSYDGGSVSTYDFDSETRLRLNLNSSLGEFKRGDIVTLCIELTPLVKNYLSVNNNVTGSFRFGMKKDCSTMSDFTVYRQSSNGDFQNASKTVQYEDWGDYITCKFNKSSLGVSYNTYVIMFQYKVDGYLDSYAHYIYLQDFNFNVSTKEEFVTGQIDNSIDKHTDKIVDNQNENSDKIVDNQNENTDKILNDWDGGKNVDDGTADNFKNAEEEALGGKSDSQIQNEINNAIDFDVNVFDSSKIGKMHSLFDNILKVCGVTYQSLFMLCLTLGLAAFLIGRRYG